MTNCYYMNKMNVPRIICSKPLCRLKPWLTLHLELSESEETTKERLHYECVFALNCKSYYLEIWRDEFSNNPPSYAPARPQWEMEHQK